MKLSNKIVLVTGGTSGIGLETAKLFRDEGAHVIVTGADPAGLDAASRELGSNVLALRADLRKPDELEKVFDEIRRRFGHLDILFANAGIGLAAPLEEVTEGQIDEQFAINFKGVFFAVQKAAPLLAKGGSIVLTTSFLNAVGTSGLSILSATKAAVRSLARSLGAELAPRGIRVNAVSPGPISTPFHGKLGLSQQELKEAAGKIEAQVPLHRFGEPDEVARTVLFSRQRGCIIHYRIGGRRGRRIDAALTRAAGLHARRRTEPLALPVDLRATADPIRLFCRPLKSAQAPAADTAPASAGPACPSIRPRVNGW